MSSKEIYVFIALGSENFLVGKLWCHTRKERESASFEYYVREQLYTMYPVCTQGQTPFCYGSA